MSDEQKNPRDVVDAAIQETSGDIAEASGANGAICTGWFLVSEWSDTAGQPWMSVMNSAGLTTWRARGLLSEAINDLGPSE